MFRMFGLCALLALGGECPDQTIKRVDGEVTTHSIQRCGSGINTTITGVQIQVPENSCPLLVIVVPPHDTTEHSPDSGTETKPGNTVPITRLTYECMVHWLFGIVPIPISTSCSLTSTQTAGALVNYTQHTCTSPIE